MTLFEKSIRILELPAILNMLASECSGEGAKEDALALTPSADIYEVRRRQEETSAAKGMMVVKGSPAFTGVSDVRGAVRRSSIGGALNTVELLNIASLLRSAASAVSYASGDRSGKNAIDYLFGSIRTNKYLENKISTSIIGPDEIADSASSELSDIRRHMRIAGDKVRQSLNKVISSPYYQKVLQEPIITVKNDRYVVPVKAEFKSSLPGLVHDISSSGATLFIEPMSAVQANNEIRELLAKEKKEIERILHELSAEVSSYAEDIISDYKIITELDLIFAKAKLSYLMNGSEPELCEDSTLILRHARHPLIDKKAVVPTDIRLGGDYDTLVITGPNTGGKTVTLKTLGLFSLMTQCGLHIPADDGSKLPVFGAVLADIGDEQSIEQSLSTFSAHMTNIVKILDECTENTLLLFDELGAGTDPVEGAALAISIIEYARREGAMIAATTHYAELKQYATTVKGVQNASCEFDVDTLRPTYRLLIGIPGKSNAFAISKRLGLSDKVIEDARSRVGTENASFEEVLAHLESVRHQMEKEREEVQILLQKARENEQKTSEARAVAEKEREKAAVIAKREADNIIYEARRTANHVFDELSDMRKKLAKDEEWQKYNEQKAELMRKLNEAEDNLGSGKDVEVPPPSSRPVEPGDRVKLISLGTEADVISKSADNILTLQAGIMKITAKEDEVRLIEGKRTPDVKKFIAQRDIKLRNIAAKPEVDLRGMMVDEAIPVMERFLDGAKMGNLNQVTIIHGKGTGALREAVRQALRKYPGIKSFRLGRYGEGEAGVTIVEFK